MMLPIRPELVLFDLDGTLADTAADLARSVDLMCAELGIPPRGEQKVRGWVGNGMETLVRRALTDDYDAAADAVLHRQAMALFNEIYMANACKLSRCYPGVEATLGQLQQQGYQLACVTNKKTRFTTIVLESLGLMHYFGVVVSGDTVGTRKPDPAPLLYAASHFDIAPEYCLMVGDSDNDVRAARAAGFQILCVSYGYNAGKDIRDSGADVIVDTLTDLPRLLELCR